MSTLETATAADYADAMLIARRGKNTLVLLLLLILLGELALFFTLRYGHNLLPQSSATTLPVSPRAGMIIEYLTGGGLFLGIVLSVVLSFVLLLIVNIMLVGRLIGVSRVISGYLWCLLLMVLLFPWQAFLNNVQLTPDRATFKVPGVLYTWDELSDPVTGAHFSTDDPMKAGLKWTRYVGMPIVATILLLAVQAKSNRGLRQALGEDVLLSLEPPTHA